MARPFRLVIASCTRKLYEGRVEHVRLPAVDGYMGILAHHARMLAVLGYGNITVRPYAADDEYTFTCFGGVAEVGEDNVVRLYLDSGEPVEEIDPERALAAKQRAEERLKRVREDRSIDERRARAALLRALLRLKAAEAVRR